MPNEKLPPHAVAHVDNRVERERLFHQRYYSSTGIRESTDKYYIVTRAMLQRYLNLIGNQLEQRHEHPPKLLELGCGTGEYLQRWLAFDADVSGIDMSAAAIELARKRMLDYKKTDGAHCESRFDLSVMNAEQTDFSENTFDVVVGSGILHHLDLDKSYSEIARILKPKGHMIFYEPLGHNPLIKLYRYLTSKLRTPDERPLSQMDIDSLNNYFVDVRVDYFCLFSLFSVPVRNTFLFKPTYDLLTKLDNMLFKVKWAQRFAWIVIIHAQMPKEKG